MAMKHAGIIDCLKSPNGYTIQLTIIHSVSPTRHAQVANVRAQKRGQDARQRRVLHFTEPEQCVETLEVTSPPRYRGLTGMPR